MEEIETEFILFVFVILVFIIVCLSTRELRITGIAILSGIIAGTLWNFLGITYGIIVLVISAVVTHPKIINKIEEWIQNK